jgi:uncharacterized secreted protein with C-terminal beta-propeller domain
MVRLNRMPLIGFLGLLVTMLVGCTDDSGINVTNNPVTDGSLPTNVTTVTDTAVTSATVTMTVTSSGTDTATTSTGTTTATGTKSGTDTATSTDTGTKTATAVTTTVTATATVTSIITVTGTTSATSTATYSATNGNVTVILSYPPAWSCPTSTSTGDGGATGTAILPTDSTLSNTDCKSLANLRRPLLKEQSQSALSSARNNLVYANCTGKTETRCLDKNGKQISTGYCPYGYSAGADAGVSYSAGGAMASAGSSGAPGIGGAAGSTGATEYSTTNTQVASVDEADYVKNDGNSIFVLAKDGLHVLDAWPAAETHEVAHVSLAGEPRRLYFSDNRLVVYSRIQATGANGSAGTSNPSDQGCTYGYDCRFSSEGGHTLLQVFDVTTPANPTELMRYELSGGYVDSRRVGAFIYTVAHDTGATQIPGLDYTLQATSYEDLQAKYAQRIADNNAKIDATSDDYFLPWVQTVKPDGTTAVVSSCQQALVTQGAQGASFVSINTFDLTKLGPPTRTVIASNAGYIYASPTALYMAVDRTYEQDYLGSTSYYYGSYQAADSFVHKFNLNGTDTSYVGSVTLTGHILNQFSMDESDGILRVASTKGWVPDASVISYLTTYGMQAGKLVQLGQVGGIGPQEDIRSVRFDGNRGYVVTFKKTDPLYVFDLTDATKPKLMGELQIPGFSTYMQRLDDTHVLAIGFTADDHESFAFFNGIQIQIFDVSDLANPKLAWKHVIGTRGSSSEALTNHLAFNYFAPKKMLALPITVCEGGGDGTYATNLTFAGVMAFDISLDTGISEHGRLPFIDAGTVAATDSCDKWWTDSKSLVKRSIFMDDYIYGLSDTQMRVAALPAMSSVLKSLPLSSL